MTPERWKEIQDVFAAALEREATGREEFLRGACRGDPSLLREVESLLSSHQEVSAHFLDSPMVEGANAIPTQTLAAGTRLGPYEILAPLGAGGMAEVYRARDRKLERDVAIKVLPEQLNASDAALARFEREALALAALSHPNILAIHDFGTQDGRAYAVMELLEGETLRDRVAKGPIASPQALDWALQIARGLAAAHDRGVRHRDLKPENLFVTNSGHVKILDFGLARRVAVGNPDPRAPSRTDSDLTEPGLVIGTVGYMSPEQVRGFTADHRSDIFSFGAILFELLSGKRAFKRATPADTMAAILKEEPPDLPSVPPALASIVRRCLEKDPEGRFSSAHELFSALEGAATESPAAPRRRIAGRIFAALLVAVLLVGGAFLLRRARPSGGEEPAARRIAVLPFENLGRPEDGYFADGIADAVRGKLASLKGFEVIARESSDAYRKTTQKPERIASELGARYLLKATVRRTKDGDATRVHVTPELVEVKAGGGPTLAWEEPFEAPLNDVFQVQADIASRVAQALGVTLDASEERGLGTSPTRNVAAYDAFLKGLEADYHLDWTRGIDFYERAIAIDPGYARAWAYLSEACSFLFLQSPTADLAEKARTAAEKSIALAPAEADGPFALGRYEAFVAHDWRKARDAFARGLTLEPGNPNLLAMSAQAEAGLGDWRKAEQSARTVVRLNPRSGKAKDILAMTLISQRRFAESRAVLDAALARAPRNTGFIAEKARTYLGEGNLDGARQLIRSAARDVEPTTFVVDLAGRENLVWLLDDEQTELLLRLPIGAWNNDRVARGLSLATMYNLRGDPEHQHQYAEEARQALEERLKALPDDADSHACLGLALAYLGRKEPAIQEGRRGMALMPVSKDAIDGPAYLFALALIYTTVGEPDRAVAELKALLEIPFFVSSAWLRVDPTFAALRSDPGFQRLVQRP